MMTNDFMLLSAKVKNVDFFYNFSNFITTVRFT